jgi:hypothetical protein
MKSLRTIAALAALALLLGAPAAQAGNIGVYFDSAATTSTATKGTSTPFNLYVCMTDVQNQMTAVEYKVNLPSELIVIGETFAGNFVNGQGSASGVQMGFADCMLLWNSTDVMVVSTLQVLAFSAVNNAAITVSKWPVPQPGVTLPRFSTCPTPDPQLVDLTPQTATLTTAVPVESASFGAVKALYRE